MFGLRSSTKTSCTQAQHWAFCLRSPLRAAPESPPGSRHQRWTTQRGTQRGTRRTIATTPQTRRMLPAARSRRTVKHCCRSCRKRGTTTDGLLQWVGTLGEQGVLATPRPAGSISSIAMQRNSSFKSMPISCTRNAFLVVKRRPHVSQT